LILSVRSLRFALFVKERHRSQNQGSLKSKERFQRAMCPALHTIHTYAFDTGWWGEGAGARVRKF